MSIVSLFMPRIEADYSSTDMIDAFYINEIATISRVAYKPYVADNKLYYRAYVNIHEWHETESAYNFIQRIKNPNKEARFIYEDENWFVVRIDPKPWLLDLAECIITSNHLLDNIDINDRSGFMGLQPIDSDWNDIKDIVSNALDEFNYEFENYDDYDEDDLDGDKWDEDKAEYEEYLRQQDDEYEEYLRQLDFEQDAEYWYEEEMEERLKNKKNMSAKEFSVWEKDRKHNQTTQEFMYENYLRTGYAVL